jgi:hypothetical protein
MRNLEILLHASTELVKLDKERNEQMNCFCLDEFSHRLYILTTENVLYCFGYSQILPANTVKLKYSVDFNVEQKASAISIDYIQELNALVLAYSNGSIFTMSNQNEEQGKL